MTVMVVPSPSYDEHPIPELRNTEILNTDSSTKFPVVQLHVLLIWLIAICELVLNSRCIKTTIFHFIGVVFLNKKYDAYIFQIERPAIPLILTDFDSSD